MVRFIRSACSDPSRRDRFGQAYGLRESRCTANLVQHALEGPEVNLDQAAALPTKVKLYPQDKWAWGWNNSSEVWNGRLAMLGFSAFLLELLSGRGPLHSLGLL